MTIQCIKEMPCTLKVAYILIVILFILNIITIISLKKQDSIKEWINKNPAVILESVNKYAEQKQREMMQEQQAQAGANIGKYSDELKDTKYAGIINPKGKIDIIEFYDYNCSYCKIATKNVEELLKTRKDVRVILRAIPILGEASTYATQVGMAILISEPAKYADYHKALMNGSARSKEDVAKAVNSIGLKMSRIEKIMQDKKNEIDEGISNNMDLASKVGVNGTPAFIINGELIPGAVDANTLNGMLSK